MRPREPESRTLTLPGSATVAELARLPRKSHSFALTPGPDTLADIQNELGLIGLRKVRLTGRLDPGGARDWTLVAHLGATVVQPCTVTLAPVTTRLEEDVQRRYIEDWQAPEAGSEEEMPEDDSAEALPAKISLLTLITEELSLALPLYPRAEGASFDDANVTEPGKAAMTDEQAKPFSGLAALRDRLNGKGNTDDD